MNREKLKQARQMKDSIMNAFVWGAAALTVGFLFWIIWYISFQRFAVCKLGLYYGYIHSNG